MHCWFCRRIVFWRERGWIHRWGWWMCWWWHFDRGNFDLTGPRLSHESKCVSQSLEMEGRSLWLWHPCEGLRLLGVKCDTSLGRCWFSVATAQQTSSHGVWRGVWVRGVGSTSHWTENGGLLLFVRKAIIWQLANHAPRPLNPPPHLISTLSVVLNMHFIESQKSCVQFLRDIKCVFCFLWRLKVWSGQFFTSVSLPPLAEQFWSFTFELSIWSFPWCQDCFWQAAVALSAQVQTCHFKEWVFKVYKQPPCHVF